jgi:hypothetical protein
MITAVSKAYARVQFHSAKARANVLFFFSRENRAKAVRTYINLPQASVVVTSRWLDSQSQRGMYDEGILNSPFILIARLSPN